MKIENYKKAMQFRLYVPVLILFILLISVFYIFNIEKYFIYPIISSLLFIFLIIILYVQPHYFSYESKNSSLIFKFYNPYSFGKKIFSFVINSSELHNYKIENSLFGLKKQIHIEIKKNKQIGTYNPISISLLKKSQIENLKKELDFVINSNKN